jgi:hypothetical protein
MRRTSSSTAINPASEELVSLARNVIERHNRGAPDRWTTEADAAYAKRKMETLLGYRLPGDAVFDLPSPPVTTVTFRSYDAAIVWVEWCMGQLSDGKYEDRRGWLEFRKLEVAVDAELARSGLRERSPGKRYNPPFRVRFTDMNDQFDARELPGTTPRTEEQHRSDVTQIYSQLPTSDLHDLLTDIETAVNGGRPGYAFAMRHPDGRVVAVETNGDRITIGITLVDGERIERERRAENLAMDVKAFRVEMESEGFVKT